MENFYTLWHLMSVSNNPLSLLISTSTPTIPYQFALFVIEKNIKEAAYYKILKMMPIFYN